MDYSDISKEHLDAHIDRIVDIADQIQLNKITVLTGGNALGKSLIRKQINFTLAHKLDELGIKHSKNITSSVSMQLRTENKPEWGAFSNIAADLPWSSTSEHTVYCLDMMLNNFKEFVSEDKKRFLVIDELEIGMSKEVQMGTCIFLNEIFKTIKDNIFGILIITHSDTVVNNVEFDEFINIEGMTKDEWLNREIVPVDPHVMKEWAMKLFEAIRDRQ